MKTLATLVIAGAVALVSFGAVAAPNCTNAPRDKWMPEQQLKDNLVKDGYVIDRFLVSGNCYEIYGTDKSLVRDLHPLADADTYR